MNLNIPHCESVSRVAQSTRSAWLRARRPGDRGSIPGRGERIFPLTSVPRPALGSNPASGTMGTGGPFPGAKARPGRDADHSPTSSAEVDNE
jgi:hypothetical protein